MFYIRISFLFLLLIFSTKAFSSVFIVTSNADSGPGTLREALTLAAANGSATTDYINFNLAVPTVTLLSALPAVSSNIIIDGTTQPGSATGINGAKVILYAAIGANTSFQSFFDISDQQSIEIYGFIFDIPAVLINSGYNTPAGIYSFQNSQNITIGAPGKGNVFYNIGLGIIFDDATSGATILSGNIKISSNIFGLDATGKSLSKLALVAIDAFRVNNLTVGGITAAEGNTFCSQVNIDEQDYQFSASTGALLVSNNYFGTDFTATKVIPNYQSGSTLLISSYNLTQLEISKNIFAAQSDIGLSHINCFFKIIGNKFGTDVTGTNVLGTFQFPLLFGYCPGGGVVGGNNPGDGNIFAGAYTDPRITSPINEGVVVNVGTMGVELVNNSFRCNNSTYPYQLQGADFSKYFVTIANRTPNAIFGTASPTSRVDLYYSLSCDHCEPEQFFQSVNADANGNWNYNGVLSNNNIIAASTLNGTTSEFTALRFTNQPTDVKITMACGGQSNGSIIGLTTNVPASYAWYDEKGNKIAITKDLINAPAGKYSLTISDGYCSSASSVFEIKDLANTINASAIKINPASCGGQTGSITGIVVDPSSLITWTDQSGNIRSNNIDLTSIEPGNYTLSVSTPDKSCTETYGPVKVTNQNGPNIDQTKAVIQSTNCGQSTGSISNIVVTGTGTLTYIWWNDQQQKVSTGKDLLNQPAGIYQLEVTGDSQCGPIYTSNIQIPETNGITLDETNAQTTIASCSKNNGSVTGIKPTGATQYQWIDANNKVVSSAVDLKDVASGDYTLTVSNNFGCSKTSKTYHVGQTAPTVFPLYTATMIPSCFGDNHSSVSVAVDGLVKNVRWVNNQGQTVGTTNTLSNVSPGTYQLYLTDQNGCENYYNSYLVSELPEYIVASYGQVTNDHCGLKTGGITATTITGGLPPYTYKWRNLNGDQLGTTSSLSNIGAGTYILNVVDTKCGNVDITYTVPENDEIISAPSVSNLQLCSSGNALISVNNPSATAVYRLYDNATSAQPLYEQTGGRFNINISGNRSYYVSQLNGTCESPRAQIDITVGLSALNIPNAFTPNGDGINDYWKINGMENYPTCTIQVFTRYGQKVFESKGYVHPFDGTMNGKPLAVGVYYYLINLSSNCSILSGNLTIIR